MSGFRSGDGGASARPYHTVASGGRDRRRWEDRDVGGREDALDVG